ncbi:uncharacterized protein LOC100371566 [Saccoglossus kowalevskii]|uniref:Zinc finger C2HC domain-containing protein 1A-like n=1 Tax=Saccoglossus kowalevskii TaxID=10224 RepID=A0ABM0GP49_SACKO|nr:PREDICTED: zinc finger C2HC domain-containing protein 1A-like [Saccoglossus kowalevskii]
MAAASAYGEAGPLSPCRHCGRTFNSNSLVKHQRVCQRLSYKRPVFDSGRQRASDSDVPFGATLKPGKKPQPVRSKNNWRAAHKEFVETIRNARAAVRAMRAGQPLPPPPQPSENPDYVYCNSCHRQFNKQSAKRHIPFCQSRKKELGQPISFAGRSVNKGYGSKDSAGREYARSIPKPRPIPRPRSSLSNYSKKSSFTSRSYKSSRKSTNAPIADPFQDIPYDYDSPIPTNLSNGVTNSSPFTFGLYMGSHSPRVYQDQPCTFSATGLTPIMTHGNQYGKKAKHQTGPTALRSRAISAKYRHMNGRKSAHLYDSVESSDSQEQFNVGLPPVSRVLNSRNQRRPAKLPRYTTLGPESSLKTGKLRSMGYTSPEYEDYCNRCGDRFPDTTSRFCCNCGVRRGLDLGITTGTY